MSCVCDIQVWPVLEWDEIQQQHHSKYEKDKREGPYSCFTYAANTGLRGVCSIARDAEL